MELLNCPVCDSLEHTAIYKFSVPVSTYSDEHGATARPLNICCCDNCGHVWNRAFDPGDVGFIYQYQPASNAPVSEAAHRRFNEVIEFIGEDNLRDKRVVEIGGGSGDMSMRMAELAKEVVVFEPNQTQINHERITHERRMFEGYDKKADLFFMRGTLEHIADPVDILKAISRSMTPDAKVYLEVPNVKAIFEDSLWCDFHYPHVHYFSVDTLTLAAKRAGLHIIKQMPTASNHDFAVLLGKTSSKTIVPDGWWQSCLDQQMLFQKKTLGKSFAVYGATAVAVNLVECLGPKSRAKYVFDDNDLLTNGYWYIPTVSGGAIPIVKPSEANVSELDLIIIGCYLHADVIKKTLIEDLNFKGEIYIPSSRRA